MLRSALAALVLLTVAAATSGAAPAAGSREPDGYRQIDRELRIGADVLRAALADALPESRQVLEVEAGYLADQGVLVIVEMASPWFRIDGRRYDVDPRITSLEQIPAMVQEILGELELGLAPEQVEDLKELRAIRESQRGVRAEQRALRAQLREKRRALLRAGDTGAADALTHEIEALQAELAAVEEDERALEQDAVTVRDTLETPERRPNGDQNDAPANLDDAIAESVCAYGATFKTLSGEQRVNVLVRQAGASRYYVFRMAEVRKCQEGDVTPEALLAESFVYES